ncbi:MAG: FKBP-type peptidylprolyl isomerase [Flavobacterium sp.]|uniref:FKBP-type peptidyl-prolyl cis-trans isomerase n=1 Tax=Flavobacterium sp. TaxID=239 RepID=UPI002616C1A2|nr:FKBP-type peptidylprolyl isomerase [Flavobacterium sp.]MDD5151068.1 FKBP-type peptidylprolyl isomerase [Flavobacterium sp.]
MNKFKYYFILLIITVSISSCSKNDVAPVEPPRDYNVQYTTDITDIEDYLKANYITVVNHPGFADDQDITITKIPDGGNQPSIYSYLNADTFPKLLVHEVALHDIVNNYKVYYLVLREGVGQSPCNVDGVLAAYKGEYLERIAATTTTAETITSTGFEEVKYPQTILSLYSTITGWSEIFPQFKTGTYVSNPDGTVSHNDFGAGVMFIPSGLAYYNSGSSSIPAYAPLVFSFKLYEIQRLDQDSDGIPSYLEDLDGDGYVRTLATGVDNIDDTDKDGIPNYLDVDDDGDNYTTKLEIKNPATGLPYPFAEIPTCTSGKKNYLDKTCHP